MEFREFLDKKTENKYNFVKLTEVRFDGKDTCTCKFVYDGNVRDLCDSDKSLFSDLIKEFIGADLNIVVKFKKEAFDNEVLFQYVSTYFQKYFPSAYSSFKPNNLNIVELNNEYVTIKIGVLDIYYDYFKEKMFETELKKYLGRYYFKDINVVLDKVSTNNKTEEDLIEQEAIAQNIVDEFNASLIIEYFNVTDVRKLIGEELDSKCMFYNSLRKPQKDIITAGKIESIFSRTFKSKKLNEDGTAIEKVYYNIKLSLRDEILDLVYFPKDTDLANFQTLKEGDEIVINGDIEEYNGRTNCKVRQISLCKLPVFEEAKILYKPVNDNYKFVTPKKYVVNEQPDLFNFNAIVKVNDILNSKTFVVYDFETTGLNLSDDEIIEIGAVKVINGKIAETFDTFVKPTRFTKLPDDIVEMTHITNEMLKDALNMGDVIQDFYKFCYGTILVGHNNIGFDNVFLQRYARQFKYNFDNRQLDTLNISKEYIKNVKNYKLSTLAKYFGVNLDNAHRAIYDTIATAEVFIKLTNYMQSI